MCNCTTLYVNHVRKAQNAFYVDNVILREMKLNTLNTIVDDILLELRNSTIGESEHISRIQIESWVHNYRAYLIRQEIEKGYDINDMYITTIPMVHLDKTEDVPGHFTYVSELELPKLIQFHKKPGVVYVKDMFGNIIQRGDETKSKLQKYRKYTCKDYIWWLKDNRILIDGDSDQLEYITIGIIAENPADVAECFDPDAPYPAPAHMIPTIKDLIFSKELRIMPQMPSDDTNNSQDNTQNIYKK